ncbi:MAG TPA: formyltransferase family protein [Thermomicrobiales bacterium]|nr:formyltransferase family protein [Thermomicrobiales bacterium]
MTAPPPDSPTLRLVFFGMFGPLSRLPLAALLAAGCDVRAVVVPPREGGGDGAAPRRLEPPPGYDARPAGLAALLRQTVVDLAWERGIPVLEVARPGAPETLAALAAYAPDLIAVSCFPSRLPRTLRALPRLGCLNLHPALLPTNRGPAPLFWTFREGLSRTGVTAHLMDGGLDSGPIVVQEGFDLADGTTGDELELRCAALGGEVLVAAARGLADGTLAPRPQDEARATAHPWPCAADFVVTPDRPARWAFNFIRGTAGWGYPHRLVTPAGACTVRAALAYDPAARLAAPLVRAGAAVRVRCAPGVLTVAVAD